MSQPEASEKRDRRPPAPSPYLLTAVLFGFGCWFGYDGWFNPEIEAVWFNRIGAPLFFGCALWDGLRLRRRLQEKAGAEPPDGTRS